MIFKILIISCFLNILLGALSLKNVSGIVFVAGKN